MSIVFEILNLFEVSIIFAKELIWESFSFLKVQMILNSIFIKIGNTFRFFPFSLARNKLKKGF